MSKAVYDPTSVEGDAFDQDNMVDGATNKNYTATEKTKLAGIETGADVTDATNVDAAGAVMNADTSTASMDFVVDEDDMSSDSATKVPTQQSVKAYVDSNNKFYTGQFTGSNSTGNQTISGVGFTPKFVKIRLAISDSTGSFFQMDGSSDGTRQNVNGAVGSTTPAFARWSNTTTVITVKSTAGTVIAAATLSSFNSDGFVINWSTASALSFNFECYS